MSKSNNNNNQMAAVGLAMAAAASLAFYLYLKQEDEEKVKVSSKPKKLSDEAPSSTAADRSLDVDSNLTPKTSNASPAKNSPKKLDDDSRLEEKKLHLQIEDLDKKGKAFFRNKQVRFAFWNTYYLLLTAGAISNAPIFCFHSFLTVSLFLSGSSWKPHKHLRKR
jgi:hypothetical protein